MERKYVDVSMEMLNFIEKSPSVFHVVANIENILKEKGFVRLEEKESWSLEYGKSYYVIRNDSSAIAFRIPNKEHIDGFHIVAAHSDSPTFKIKENPEMSVEKQYVILNTEKYGGAILSTWLDRPLSIAGRIAV